MTDTLHRAERWAWILGAVGLVGAALGWLLMPRVFAYGWLAAFTAWSGWPLGSMALLLAHALTGGRWGETIRPALLLGTAATPLLVLLAIPVLVMMPVLYPWVRESAQLPNGWYLNVTFFAIRGAVYLIAWVAIALLILSGNAARIAAPALLALAVTFTFAAIDLTMSLEPKFTSSIYGMLASAGAGLLALSVAVALSAPLAPPRARQDLGKLMLGLAILWTYLDFMQLLIVWQSDLVSQAPWYLHRAFGFWGWVMAGIAIAHSAIPILILLWPQMRGRGRVLAALGLWLVLIEIVRAWWTVLPAASPPLLPGLVDLACVAAMGGLGAGFALWRHRARRAEVGYA